VFPATHYAADSVVLARAMASIEVELQERLAFFEKEGKLLEAQRLRMRTEHDLEMLGEVGFCSGVENYSAPIDGRRAGEPALHVVGLFPR
jgi:Excinuclease ABC subunit B